MSLLRKIFGRRQDRLERVTERLDKIAARISDIKSAHQRDAKRLEERLTGLDTRLFDVRKELKHERRQRAEIKGKLATLLRRHYVDKLLVDQLPFSLLAHRFSLLSQNEEDGMTLALLADVGAPNKSFVEIGSGTNGGNSGILAEELGWRGLMIEMNPTRASQCARRFGGDQRVICICAAVTPENVNALILDNGFAGEVDLLSLDIDSFDYWVFEAMSACSPRILILEYNAHFGPDLAVTNPRDANLADASDGYQGASLVALTDAARRKRISAGGMRSVGHECLFCS